MVNDWYQWYADGKYYQYQVKAEDFTKDYVTNFEPIPLTAEILEKNGFERRGCISYHKPHIGLIIHHWNDDLCFLNYSKKNIPPIMIPFHYVHELQHALRLCGLNGLADGLKL